MPNLIQNCMNFEVFCKGTIPCESFAAVVALEQLLSCVRSHMALQIGCGFAFVVALVATVWLFLCVGPHHMNFQITIGSAGILAHCASVRLFPRVGPFVLLQIA